MGNLLGCIYQVNLDGSFSPAEEEAWKALLALIWLDIKDWKHLRAGARSSINTIQMRIDRAINRDHAFAQSLYEMGFLNSSERNGRAVQQPVVFLVRRGVHLHILEEEQ